MPEMEPVVPYGLSEAVDIFIIGQLRNLYQFYTNQQGETKKIDVKAVWTKGEVSSYPFVGVMTHIPRNEPIALSDDWTDPIYKATINEARIGLGLQAIELRELARLRDFTLLNLERGQHPQTHQPWRVFLADNNIMLDYEEMDPPEQVDFRLLQMRTRLAQGQETEERTDIETLWIQDVTLCAKVQFNVPLVVSQGIINGIDLNLTLDIED